MRDANLPGRIAELFAIRAERILIFWLVEYILSRVDRLRDIMLSKG